MSDSQRLSGGEVERVVEYPWCYTHSVQKSIPRVLTFWDRYVKIREAWYTDHRSYCDLGVVCCN